VTRRAAALAAGLLALGLASCDKGARLEVAPRQASLPPGGSQQFTVLVTRSASTNVRWLVASGGGVISRSGLYKAPYDTLHAPVTVTVRAQIDDRSEARTVADVRAGVASRPHDDALMVRQAGVFPGADSCHGLSQARLPNLGETVTVDSFPRALVRVSPIYPDTARRLGVQGTVLLAGLVCRSGNVADTWVFSSVPLLDRAAEDAARQWVFAPAKVGDHAVAVWVFFSFRFTLQGPVAAAARFDPSPLGLERELIELKDASPR